MSKRAAKFHRTPWQGVFYITGGGTQFVSELLTTPGASRSVLEATVPYANTALEDMLGRTPAQACSAPTARAMAMAAFRRADQLSASDADRATIFGLGCTASLATDREKRSRHRAHLALQTDWYTHFVEFEFSGDRPAEETQLQDRIWTFMNSALAVEPASELAFTSVRAHSGWRDVLLGRSLAIATKPHNGELILSGSFNPVHHGHQRMLSVAERLTGRTGAYELSIVNPDKPPLDYAEIQTRLAQFQTPVWLTRLPTFVEKAERFPGATFAVGVDTVVRIDNPGYYLDTTRRDAAVERLAAQGCRFLVFGRLDGDRFIQFHDVDLSPAFREICQEVPAEAFREDVSSTQLRWNAK